MDNFIDRMNQIEDLLTLIKADISWEMCWLEPVLAINDGEQFIKCYQCEDGIMYDVYDIDPRDEEDLESTDGWCLVNTKEDMDIDFYGILSKLEFIGKAHLPTEVLYWVSQYWDGNHGVSACLNVFDTLEEANDYLIECVKTELDYYRSDELIEKFFADFPDFNTEYESESEFWGYFYYGKNQWRMYLWYHEWDCNYGKFAVYPVHAWSALEISF